MKINSAYIELTSFCNLACKHCYNNSSSSLKKKTELNKDSLKKFLDELYDLGCENIYLSGGEPLKYPNLIDILKHINRKMKVCLATNATLIDETLINELGEYIDYFQISLDGAEKENDSIRGYKSYFKAIEAIKIIKKKNKQVNIHSVLLNNNLSYIESFVTELKNLGVEHITFALVNPIGRAKNNQKFISMNYKNIFMLNDLFKKLSEQENIKIDILQAPCGPCPINDESQPLNLKVDYFGDIYFCQRFTSNHLFSLGNIHDQSLKSILISNEFDNMKQLIEISTKYINKCKNCINETICLQPCPADIINSNNMFDYNDNYCDERKKMGSVL